MTIAATGLAQQKLTYRLLAPFSLEDADVDDDGDVVRAAASSPGLLPVAPDVEVAVAELVLRVIVSIGIVSPLGDGSTVVVMQGCCESGQVPLRSRSLSSGPVGPSS